MSIGFAGGTQDVIAASRSWWRSHGLDVDLRTDLSLASTVMSDIGSAFAFPSVDQQEIHRAAIIELGSYGGPVSMLDDELDTPIDRPDGPYLMVLDDDMADWTRGLTAKGLSAALRTHDRVGLSVLEYLALQRRAFEVFGDHRFDDYTGVPSGWTWLPGSTAGSLHTMAYYYARNDRVEVSACKAGSKNLRKGARTARVVPLEPA